MDPNPPPAPPAPTTPGATSPAPRSGRSWWIFLGVLIAPALLTLATARMQDAWPFFTFLGSMAAGLFCGFWLSWRIADTASGKLLGGMALAFLFAAVSFVLCCAGCALGGTQLNFH